MLSLTRAIQKFEKKFLITTDINEIKEATHIFLPGVGAFKKAMDNLQKNNLKNLLMSLDYKKINLLGICLGMQILFDSSDEDGFENGSVKQYFQNGQVKSEYIMKNGAGNVEFSKNWYQNGQLKSHCIYEENGNYVVSKDCWDEDGNQIECERTAEEMNNEI